MAFSILRYGARNLVRHLMERNVAAVHLLTNAKPSRGMADSCTCTPFSCVITKPDNTPVFFREYSKQIKRQKKHQSDSESDSDSDLEAIGHKGESDFWRRKMRTFHGLIDVNKDGVISFDDFKLLANRFINLGHLSKEEANDFQKIIKSLWENQWGEITPYNLVTVEQYLADMHHVLNDREQRKRAHSFLPYLFKAVDKDRSGEISIQEFKLFFECLGLQEKDAEIAFRSIDANRDGKISLKEFVKHGKDFFHTEDESRISRHFWGPLVEAH